MRHERAGGPAASRAQATSDGLVLDGATRIRKRKATAGKLVSTILAALVVALILSAAVCLLPENDYQRWQLQDRDGRLRWIYERIHFDPTRIDVAILGPSRAQLGLSAAAVEQDLAKQGKPAHVANFALPGAGRDIQWAILNELFKAKSPKVVVLEVEEDPYPFGHFFFKYVPLRRRSSFRRRRSFITTCTTSPICRFASSPCSALTSSPICSASRSNSIRSTTQKTVPTSARVSSETASWSTWSIRFLAKPFSLSPAFPFRELCSAARSPKLSGGEDQLYVKEIAREAKAHSAQLVFVYLPMFEGPRTVSDEDFLKQFGPVLNFGDLAPQDELFENWSHLNHAGAMKASARLADAIAGLDL